MLLLALPLQTVAAAMMLACGVVRSDKSADPTVPHRHATGHVHAAQAGHEHEGATYANLGHDAPLHGSIPHSGSSDASCSGFCTGALILDMAVPHAPFPTGNVELLPFTPFHFSDHAPDRLERPPSLLV